MKSAIRVVSIFLYSSLLITCADSLFDGKKKTKADGKTSVVEADQDTLLNVTSGDLSGASVNVPTGALAVGSSVNINSADVPSSFEGHSGVSVASSPMSVTGTSPSGEALNELDSAMTLKLPISGASLALADVEKSTDNLCVFLNSAAGDFYVWRRDAMNIEDSIAVIESKLFGVYQLYYCGSQTLSAAKNAKDEKVAGSASQAILSLTIPSAYTTSYNSVCAAVIKGVSHEGRIVNLDDFKIFALSSAKISSATDLSIDVFGSPGSGLQSLGNDDEIYFVVAFQETTNNGCQTNPANKTQIRDFIAGKKTIGFRRKASSVKAATLTATLGEGDMELSSSSLSLATPAGSMAPFAANGCLSVSTKGDGEGGFSHTLFSIAATTGKVNNAASLSISSVPSSNAENESAAYLNTQDCFADSVYNSTVTDSVDSQPYASIWRNQTLSSGLKLVATNFKVKTNAALVLLNDRACLQLFSTDLGDVTGLSLEDRASKRVFEYVSKLATSFSNDKFYLPYNADNEYDGFIKPLTDDESCSSNKDGYSVADYSYPNFQTIDVLPVP